MARDNGERAELAEEAINALDIASGETGSLSDEELLIDLLANLRHWAKREGLNFDKANNTAEVHYLVEAVA